MSRFAKAAILLLVMTANLAVLWWRYEHRAPEIKGVGPHIAALGAKQADTVVGWRSAKPVPLTHDAIWHFAETAKWGGCADLPPQATVVARDDLSSKRQQALSTMFAGLIETYTQGDPARLYDYMTANGEELSPSSIATLQQLLITDGDVSPAIAKSYQPRELFILIGQKIHYGSHWKALAADSACITLWRTNVDLNVLGDDIPLGGPMVRLFKNQTRFHHLFQPVAKQHNVSISNAIFADVQFVVKHDPSLMSEPSAYHVRLRLGSDSETWHPVEMIHVATISGHSPPLLF